MAHFTRSRQALGSVALVTLALPTSACGSVREAPDVDPADHPVACQVDARSVVPTPVEPSSCWQSPAFELRRSRPCPSDVSAAC